MNEAHDNKQHALDMAQDSIMEALMNEGVTLDELTELIQDVLKDYVELAKRPTRHKKRII